MMAELGHNYNIQCMKLFQELKAAYPATPDELVRQCMKAVSSQEDRNTCNGKLKFMQKKVKIQTMDGRIAKLFIIKLLE